MSGSLPADQLFVCVLIPLGEFQDHHFLSLIIDVVQDPVRADTEVVLSRELQHNELTAELLGPFALRLWIRCKGSDGSYNGFPIGSRNVLQRLLKRTLDSFARKDNFVGQLQSQLFEKMFGGNLFTLGVFGARPFNFSEELLILEFIEGFDQI